MIWESDSSLKNIPVFRKARSVIKYTVHGYIHVRIKERRQKQAKSWVKVLLLYYRMHHSWAEFIKSYWWPVKFRLSVSARAFLDSAPQLPLVQSALPSNSRSGYRGRVLGVTGPPLEFWTTISFNNERRTVYNIGAKSILWTLIDSWNDQCGRSIIVLPHTASKALWISC